VTLLTKSVYDSIAPGVTNAERQEIYAYMLAAETEYFRAHRNYAGVLHFDYLTGDFHGAITGDIFKNPETLEPVKVYDDYFTEIFNPLGVYVNFFTPDVRPSSSTQIPVMLVNDEYQTVTGKIEITLVDKNEKPQGRASIPFIVDALSQQSYKIPISFPALPGNYVIKTRAIQDNGKSTLCIRKTEIK
jgi:hypothetical protein